MGDDRVEKLESLNKMLDAAAIACTVSPDMAAASSWRSRPRRAQVTSPARDNLSGCHS